MPGIDVSLSRDRGFWSEGKVSDVFDVKQGDSQTGHYSLRTSQSSFALVSATTHENRNPLEIKEQSLASNHTGLVSIGPQSKGSLPSNTGYESCIAFDDWRKGDVVDAVLDDWSEFVVVANSSGGPRSCGAAAGSRCELRLWRDGRAGTSVVGFPRDDESKCIDGSLADGQCEARRRCRWISVPAGERSVE